MNTVTQKNAANAEESASASEELSSQAEELNNMVAELEKMVGGASSENVARTKSRTPHMNFKTHSKKIAEITHHAVSPKFSSGTKQAKKKEEVHTEAAIPFNDDEGGLGQF